jgi:hypothetical protein
MHSALIRSQRQSIHQSLRINVSVGLLIVAGFIGKAIYDTRLTTEELNKINRVDELCHNTGKGY